MGKFTEYPGSLFGYLGLRADVDYTLVTVYLAKWHAMLLESMRNLRQNTVPLGCVGQYSGNALVNRPFRGGGATHARQLLDALHLVEDGSVFILLDHTEYASSC